MHKSVVPSLWVFPGWFRISYNLMNPLHGCKGHLVSLEQEKELAEMLSFILVDLPPFLDVSPG